MIFSNNKGTQLFFTPLLNPLSSAMANISPTTMSGGSYIAAFPIFLDKS